MNFVFFGSPEFARLILERLIRSSLPPHTLICNPDRPVGRDKVLTAPLTKSIAEEHSINIWQPEKLTKEEFVHAVGTPDFGVVAAYARIIPKNILDIPKHGVIGVHPSLLPKYRGASPIQSALIAGEANTGVTLYKMDEKVDHGPIIISQELSIEADDTYESLLVKLANLSSDLLVETLPTLIAGGLSPKPQDESLATFTTKFSSDDAHIDPVELKAAQEEGGEIAQTIYNKIRGLNPEPGVWTTEDGKRLKLLAAKLRDEKLVLTIIQKEGKTPVHV